MSRDGLSRRALLGTTTGTATVSIAGCTASNDDGGSGGVGGQQELRPEDWEDVDEIRLEGHTNGWIGKTPALIEEVRNPTLLFFEGEEYELTWENRDGLRHNFELRNENNVVVDGYSTGFVSHRGETQTLKFRATNAMSISISVRHTPDR